MGGLSIVVGSIASASAVSAFLLRHHLPTPALIVLGHAAVTGLFISVSASDFFSDRTAGLLGKVCSGSRLFRVAACMCSPLILSNLTHS